MHPKHTSPLSPTIPFLPWKSIKSITSIHAHFCGHCVDCRLSHSPQHRTHLSNPQWFTTLSFIPLTSSPLATTSTTSTIDKFTFARGNLPSSEWRHPLYCSLFIHWLSISVGEAWQLSDIASFVEVESGGHLDHPNTPHHMHQLSRLCVRDCQSIHKHPRWLWSFLIVSEQTSSRNAQTLVIGVRWKGFDEGSTSLQMASHSDILHRHLACSLHFGSQHTIITTATSIILTSSNTDFPHLQALPHRTSKSTEICPTDYAIVSDLHSNIWVAV